MQGIRFLALLMIVSLGSGGALWAQPQADRLAQATSFQNALEYNRSGTATRWRNPDTAGTGATVPVRTFQVADGRYCREFQQTIIIDGRQERGYGTACRQPDGHWQIVNPHSIQKPPQPAKSISRERVYDPPVRRTYPRYRPAYIHPFYPASLSLSFGYVKHKGHSHYRSRHYDRGHRHPGHYRKSGHGHPGKGVHHSHRYHGKGKRGHR